MTRVDFHTPRVTQLREARRGKGRKEERWRKRGKEGRREKEVKRSRHGKMDGGRNKCKKERKESWGDV